MIFEKHLRSVSRASSQRLGFLRKSWQVFHDRLILGRCFRGFVLPVLEYCSAVWCSAADTHHRLLDSAVSGASFLTGGVLIAHRYTYAPPRCRTSKDHRTFILLSVSLWNDLSDPVFDGVGLVVSRAGPMPFYWPSCSFTFCLLLFSLSLLSFYGLVLWGWGLRTDRVLIALSQPCITNLFF